MVLLVKYLCRYRTKHTNYLHIFKTILEFVERLWEMCFIKLENVSDSNT